MGIKTFIERKTCPKCNNGVLLPYAWRTCQKHSKRDLGVIPEKKEIKVSYIKMSEYLIEDLHFKCDKQKALQSHVLLYDENMDIIGYYSPLQVLNK